MQDVQTLADVKHELSGSDFEFAESLIMQFNDKGKLSEKQWHWVHKLIMKAEGTSSAKTPTTQIKPLNGLALMFQSASKKLKYPAIVLPDANGDDLRISRAGDSSKNPGYLYVKRAGQYLGKVSPMGEVYVDDELAVEVLKALSENPAGYAAAHGHATGKCCFCNSTLTDEKSTSVGYGPVCAKHYNLPWGASELSLKQFNDAMSSAHKEDSLLAAYDALPGPLEPEDEVIAFEKEQMKEKALRPLPDFVPGRACRDLIDYMESADA